MTASKAADRYRSAAHRLVPVTCSHCVHCIVLVFHMLAGQRAQISRHSHDTCKHLHSKEIRPGLNTLKRSLQWKLASSLAASDSVPQQITQAAQTKYPIPADVLEVLKSASNQWAEFANSKPLREPNLAARIVLLGIAHYAPLQQPAVQHVLQRIKPDAVAFEFPQTLPSNQQPLLLPYPQVLQVLLDLHEELEAQGGNEEAVGDALSSPAVQALLLELMDPSLPVSAKLGKDLIDPYEAIGFYPGVDMLLRPHQAAQLAALFGYLPGEELGAALQAALQLEAEVVCIDASVRMQEAWIAGLVREWSLKESDLTRQLLAELEAVQQLVPAVHTAWDAALSQQVAAGATHEDELLLAFKACKATAAAMIRPDAAAMQAVAGQSRLQPLKFALFERKALHMAVQLRELCRRHAASSVLLRPEHQGEATANQPFQHNSSPNPNVSHDTQNVTTTSPTTSPNVPSSNSRDDKPATTKAVHDIGPQESRPTETGGRVAPKQPYTVLAIVGRQYVPMIHRLWSDPTSALWKGDVPRTFAPSTIPETPKEIDPDVESGGSRPVGHKSTDLGQLLKDAQAKSKQ